MIRTKMLVILFILRIQCTCSGAKGIRTTNPLLMSILITCPSSTTPYIKPCGLAIPNNMLSLCVHSKLHHTPVPCTHCYFAQSALSSYFTYSNFYSFFETYLKHQLKGRVRYTSVLSQHRTCQLIQHLTIVRQWPTFKALNYLRSQTMCLVQLCICGT